MLVIALLASLLLPAQGGTLADIARAQTLISTGDVLEGTLALRAVAESDEAEPAARDVARYYLGVLRLDADDVEGARAWFSAIDREPADAHLRLSLAFRLGECEARLGHPERVVPLVAPRLRALERAFPGEVPAADVAFQALQLAYSAGHPEWVPALTGRPASQAFVDVVGGGSPEQVAALARLPGVPSDVLTRIRDARGADSAVSATVGAGSPVPGEDQLTVEFPSLRAPATGGILVPAPLTGPQAAYGLALQRVLAFVEAERQGVSAVPPAGGEPAPTAVGLWRFVDTGAAGWLDEATQVLAAGQVALVLGPLGARSLRELLPVLKEHPVPVVPLFPEVQDRGVAFPVLPLIFDLADELRALFAASPLAAGARVAVIDSEGAAARGLDVVLTDEIARAGGQVVRSWTLPANPKEQAATVAGWVAEAGAAATLPSTVQRAFDVIVLATGPAEGLRVLSLLHFQGVPLESSPAYAATPAQARALAGRSHQAPVTPVQVHALHTVLGRGFLDPVTHLSRGVRVIDPCAAAPERLAALDLALGRPAFPEERWAAHLAQVVLQARDEAAGGTVLDLARRLAADRRWTGLCGTLEVRAGKGVWDLALAPVDLLPEPEPGPAGAPPGDTPRAEPPPSAPVPADGR